MLLSLPDTTKHLINTPRYSQKCGWRCRVITLFSQVFPQLLSVYPDLPLCIWIPLKLVQSSVQFDHSGILVQQLSNAPMGSQSRKFSSLMLLILLSGITKCINWYWDPILVTWQVWIISKYKEYLQLLCAFPELWSSCFVSSEEMGLVVNDIDTMGHQQNVF
jgi:hypothetical protein